MKSLQRGRVIHTLGRLASIRRGMLVCKVIGSAGASEDLVKEANGKVPLLQGRGAVL